MDGRADQAAVPVLRQGEDRRLQLRRVPGDHPRRAQREAPPARAAGLRGALPSLELFLPLF